MFKPSVTKLLIAAIYTLPVLAYKALVPLVLIGAGLGVLYSRLSGWGLILGIPLIIIGSVLSLFNYDDFFNKYISDEPKEFLLCKVCHKPTPRFGFDRSCEICYKCKSEIQAGLISFPKTK